MPTLRPQQQGAIEIDWSQLIGSAGTAAAKRTKGGEVQLSKGTILVGGCAFVFAALALPSVAAFLSRRKQSSRRPRVGVPGTTHTEGDNSSRDIKVLLKLEHHEAERGCEKQVSYNATIGNEVVQRTATLNVPPRIVDGTAVKGSTCGDLILELLVEE